MNSVHDCKIVDLPVVHKESGAITVLENDLNIPFPIKRIYYLYDVPMGAERGGHAHYELEQYVVAASGSFKFILNDGTEKREVFLNHPNKALHIVPGIWREMKDFSSGSVCLVLASIEYTEDDYMRGYDDFLNYRKNNSFIELVSYNETFLEKSWNWLNDPKIKHLTNTGDFTKEQQQKWYSNLPFTSNYKIWGVKINGEEAGVFGIKNIENNSGEYWGYIGEKQYWGKGYGKEIMISVLNEAKKMELSEVYLKVIKDNPRAIKLYKKMGFIESGVLDNNLLMKLALI